MTMNRQRLLAAARASLAAPAAFHVRAEDKPLIRILVGLPPGGRTDAIARVIADRLAVELGQPVMIANRVGVGGRLASDALMTAAPDGLTWMIAPNATPTFQTLVLGSQIKWDIWRDFAPVAGLVSYPLGMAVSLQTGATNAREFVAWVKKKPTASFGTPGTASSTSASARTPTSSTRCGPSAASACDRTPSSSATTSSGGFRWTTRTCSA